jgi:hypothetical protein
MAYYFDFKEKSISGFIEKLKSTKLLPSQKVLEQNIDEGYAFIKGAGFNNMAELFDALKAKDSDVDLAKKSNLPENFWTVLRREIKGHHSQPRKVADFTIIDSEVRDKLTGVGIKNTKHLYNRIFNREGRTAFCEEFNIDNDTALLMIKLTDFCRLRYINADFATLLVKSDYDTIEKLKEADHVELHNHLKELNTDNKYYRAKFSVNDMELVIRDANYIDSEVEL